MERTELLTPRQVHAEYGIAVQTQATWRCSNRYGWRLLAVKLGGKIRYRRKDVEAWLESRRNMAA